MKQLLKALLVLTILASTQANAGGKTYRDNLSRIANERDDMKAKARIALRTERYIQNWNGRRVVQEEAMDNTEMQMKAVRVIVLKNLDRALKHRKKSVWAWTYSAYATANEEYKASMAAQERYLRLLESAGGRLEIDEANNKKSYTLQGEKDRALGKLNWAKAFLDDVVTLGKATDIQFNKYTYHKPDLASTLAAATDSVAKAEKLYASASEYVDKYSDTNVLARYDRSIADADYYFEEQKAVYDMAIALTLEQEASGIAMVSLAFYDENREKKK